MGLMSWLFPSPEDKLARAKDDFARGRLAQARSDARQLGDLPGAAELVLACEEALTRKNLAEAQVWIDADEPDRAKEHLERALEMAPPSLDGDVEAVELGYRAAMARQTVRRKSDANSDAARLLDVNPAFLASRKGDEIELPEGISEDEADALKARLAILVDGYPEALRGRFVALGSAFAQAVLDREDGRVRESLEALGALPDEDPLVRHERALAKLSLGDAAGAAADWQAFATLADGHHVVGPLHTSVWLARALADAGDVKAAIATMESAGNAAMETGAGLYASLLEANDRLPEAEKLVTALLRKHGTQPPLFVMLARLREKQGERMGAMRALEACLEKCACGTGSCAPGAQPDLATYRMLATLYLEDGLETERALEFAETARAMVKQPVWEDLYLATLEARQRAEPTWTDMAAHLSTRTHPEDPRRARVERYLTA